MRLLRPYSTIGDCPRRVLRADWISNQLNQWFNANWSPVENQLRRDATYLAWVEDDPAYRHVQVDGEPALAKAGRHKKDDEKQVVNAALPYSFLEFKSVLPFTQI